MLQRDDRDTSFAQAFLWNAKDRLKNNVKVYGQFLKILYDFGRGEHSPVKVNYMRHILRNHYITWGAQFTVKHFLFARTLFSRKFARPMTRKNKVRANIFHVSIIVQEMNNRENKVLWINPKSWSRENKVTRKKSVLQ